MTDTEPQSSSSLEAIIESAPIALIVSDAAGTISLVNAEAQRLFGYSREQMLGRSIEMLIPVAARGRHPGLRQHYLTLPQARRMGDGRALSAQRSDGSQLPVEIGLTPIGDGGSLQILSVVIDVSERERLLAEVRAARDELEQRIRERTSALEAANAEKEALLQDLREQRAELEELSLRDPLTLLSNRRDFDRRLALEVERARRSGAALSVAMLDLDLFKGVNDRFGHAVGDVVLCEAARVIKEQCRANDIAARYGGEEFALVFPDADGDAALKVCERIRSRFEAIEWSRRHVGLAVTLSAGIARWRDDMDAGTLLALSDAALYEAKRGGRNRVVLSRS